MFMSEGSGNPSCTGRLYLLLTLYCVQLYTQVESFASAISKLQELGLQVNVEQSELVYRGTAGD